MDLEVPWSDFKSFINARKLSIQWVDINDHYYLKGIDGAFELSCKLCKTSGVHTAEISDFESNYKANGNKSPKAQVLTLLELDDRSKRYIGFHAVANKNSTTHFMLKAPGSMSYSAGPLFNENLSNDRLVFGGWAWGTDINPGDYLQIAAVDHDNVLGAGVDYVLKNYVETDTISVYPTTGTNTVTKVAGILLNPNGLTEIQNSAPSVLYGGVWLRVSYVSTGILINPKLFVNINWEKRNW